MSPNDRLSETGQSQRTIYDSTNMRLLDIQTGRGEEGTGRKMQSSGDKWEQQHTAIIAAIIAAFSRLWSAWAMQGSLLQRRGGWGFL